jgi:hypothetical protein
MMREPAELLAGRTFITCEIFSFFMSKPNASGWKPKQKGQGEPMSRILNIFYVLIKKSTKKHLFYSFFNKILYLARYLAPLQAQPPLSPFRAGGCNFLVCDLFF